LIARPAASALQSADVVDWHRFDPAEWDIVYDIEKLAAHRISDWEAAEAMFNLIEARPNKKVHGPNRFQLLGLTDAGRALKLVVHVSARRTMRVITGWPV